ncbi:DUF2333 family protein [Desulfatiglans anilini]|uniref:DUF2333 family protein n=1 Tax=Desulfatiglans anilini TaxID=90728 RepID=UPI0003FB2991|nr:DUF2333 family protein [Desulfatiglans anilini]
MKESGKSREAGKTKWVVALVVAVLVCFSLVVMVVNSRKPEPLELSDYDRNVRGAAFVRANLVLLEQMIDNWLPNDLFWPTIFLDNMPNFQLGQLELVRYNLRVLRDELTRLRTTDKIDRLAEEAFTAISNDPRRWWFPSAESKWKLAHAKLDTFYGNLLTGKSTFYARADNLATLMTEYASLMGGINTRLMNAPGDIRAVLIDEEDAGGSGGGIEIVQVDIPWSEIDDNFYYAQGAAYALLASFKAIRVDFHDILVKKNALKLLDKVMESLQRCDFEPLIIFNGDPESVFANHSLNLSGVFNDARQKISSLIVALNQG